MMKVHDGGKTAEKITKLYNALLRCLDQFCQ